MEINIIAIFFSFVLNILKRYSSKFCSFIIERLYSFNETSEINNLNLEIKNLKREKDSYNPIDEFAKYALVDRKLNKSLDKLQIQKNKIRSVKMKKIFYFNVVYTSIIGAMSIYLIYSNYDKPIIDFSNLVEDYSSDNKGFNRLDFPDYMTNKSMPSDTLIFYPMHNFLSFPSTHKKNSIGVTAWLFLINRSIDIFINKFINNRAKID